MKHFFTVVLSISMLTAGLAQSIPVQNFYKKYAGQEGFTSIEVSETLFKLIASVEGDEELDQLDEVIDKIEGIQILVYERDNSPNAAAELYDEAMASITPGFYEELVSVTDKNENVKILVRSAKESVIDDLLIIVKDNEEFVLVSIFGQIDIGQIKQLGKSFDLEGMEHLEKIEPLDNK